MMKRSLFLFSSAMMISAMISCSGEDGLPGPQGPVGPVGPEGPQGESGFVFEYENINFVAPNFDQVLAYPSDFDGLASDVALVYLLWGTEEIDGQNVEIWRQLSQTVLHPDGLLIYNYDFTASDVRLFLQADFPLEDLPAFDTDGWIARVVVVPGSFWNSGRVDFSDYYHVKEMLGLPELPVRDREVVKRR